MTKQHARLRSSIREEANIAVPVQQRWRAQSPARLPLVVLAGIIAALLTACPAGASGPRIEYLASRNIDTRWTTDRLRWGEEATVTVRATNTSGATRPGGLYVSFDQDVLIIDVKNGSIARPGDLQYNLLKEQSLPLARPMVVSFDKSWQVGSERAVTITLRPIARSNRLRVRARVTLVAVGPPQTIYGAPGQDESRDRDETGFLTASGYVWVSPLQNLRGALRRIERSLREQDETQRRLFAVALGMALEDASFLKDLDLIGGSLTEQQTSKSIRACMTDSLRRDPLVALDNLFRLAARLDNQRALAYFCVPRALWDELSAEEQAKLDAKRLLEREKGGDSFVALLDAEQITYALDKSRAIVLQADKQPIKVAAPGPYLSPLLDRVIELLGSAAGTEHASVAGLSFRSLKSQLSGQVPASPGSATGK